MGGFKRIGVPKGRGLWAFGGGWSALNPLAGQTSAATRCVSVGESEGKILAGARQGALQTGGGRAGWASGTSVLSPRWLRIFLTTAGSSMVAIRRIREPHLGQARTSSEKALLIRSDQAEYRFFSLAEPSSAGDSPRPWAVDCNVFEPPTEPGALVTFMAALMSPLFCSEEPGRSECWETEAHVQVGA